MAEWKVPQMWAGGRCWIIGGGPSILEQFNVPEEVAEQIKNRKVPMSTLSPYMQEIHKEHVIGINNAYQIGDWIDIVFFSDASWYAAHRLELAKYSALKVSCSPRFQGTNTKDHYSGVKFLRKDSTRKLGIHENPKYISWNYNSGAGAISLAHHLGVKQIVLLGFDMQNDSTDTSHWHGYHVEKADRRARDRKKRTKKPPRQAYNRHLRGWPTIAKHAKKLGIEVLNASPRSAIKSLPKTTVKDVLYG